MELTLPATRKIFDLHLEKPVLSAFRIELEFKRYSSLYFRTL